MNENELYVVNEYIFDNRIITEIDFILDECFRNCHNSFFLYFKFECIHDFKLKNININDIINLIISDKSMDMHELNKKIKTCSTKKFQI